MRNLFPISPSDPDDFHSTAGDALRSSLSPLWEQLGGNLLAYVREAADQASLHQLTCRTDGAAFSKTTPKTCCMTACVTGIRLQSVVVTGVILGPSYGGLHRGS